MIRKMTCIVCPNGCELEADRGWKMHLREWKFMPEGSSVCGAGGRSAEAYDRKLRGCEKRSSPTCQRAVKPCGAEGEAV